MNIATLRFYLENENVFNEFEERKYLGMSAISKCPRKLWREMMNGRFRPDLPSARMFHEGYLHERDIIQRLRTQSVDVKKCGHELVAPFDSRFVGHIDGEIDDELLEIKSVNDNRFEQVKQNGAFDEHLKQVQMYMRYGNYLSAIIVYKNRESGEIWLVNVAYCKEIADMLEAKAWAILAAVDSKTPPECTCNRCR